MYFISDYCVFLLPTCWCCSHLASVLLGLAAGDVVPLWSPAGGSLGPDTVLVLPGGGSGGWLTRLPRAVGRPGGVSAVQTATAYCQACIVRELVCALCCAERLKVY